MKIRDIIVKNKQSTDIEEDSMKKAAKKSQGAKFGGYYKATQKGPPKPGQGFGGV